MSIETRHTGGEIGLGSIKKLQWGAILFYRNVTGKLGTIIIMECWWDANMK